jgi:hypothetical protein
MPFGFGSGALPRANGTLTAEQLQVLHLHNNPNRLLQQQQQQQQQQRAAGVLQPSVTPDGLVGKLPAALNQQQQFSAALLLQQLQKGICLDFA